VSTGTGHTMLTRIWHCRRPSQLAANVHFLIRFLRSSWDRQLPGVVYVVDDDASFRAAIGRRLVYADYEVRTYSAATELLEEHPSENHAGCILLDVRMPTLSGPELQRRLGELGCTLPIVSYCA
jgi:PleD family two-component response regulator